MELERRRSILAYTNEGKRALQLQFMAVSGGWKIDHTTNKDGVFGGVSLPLKVGQELTTSVLHHFLRVAGATLPFDKVMPACEMVIASYVNKKRYRDALDLAMTISDIAINLGLSRNIRILPGLCRVVFVLKALGRHKDAGCIYYEAATDYAEAESEIEECFRVSAESFQQAACYERAEEAYLQCLCIHLKERSVDLNEEPIHRTLAAFLHVYAEWQAGVSGGKHRDFDVVKHWSIFAVLLTFAGHKAEFLTLASSSPSQEKGTVLKSSLRNKKGSRRMLDLAFQKPNVEHFRATILECGNPKLRGVAIKNVLEEEGQSRNSRKQESTAQAQELLRSKLKPIKIQVDCANPSCSVKETVEKLKDTTMKHCPCKQVYYCQKSCQPTHWSKHKQTCSHYVEMNKKQGKESK